MIVTGARHLIASCLAAPLSPQLVPLAVALFGLGIGWNMCYVAGSALLSDALSPVEKARMQGLNDLLVGGAAAAAALLGGVIMATGGYTVMGLLGAAVSLPLLFIVGRLPRVALPQAG
jgi:MFS family permease